MEYDIHTLLDSATLASTLWVIYMIRFKLKSSYMEDKDNFAIYYVVSILSTCSTICTIIELISGYHLIWKNVKGSQVFYVAAIQNFVS